MMNQFVPLKSEVLVSLVDQFINLLIINRVVPSIVSAAKAYYYSSIIFFIGRIVIANFNNPKYIFFTSACTSPSPETSNLLET